MPQQWRKATEQFVMVVSLWLGLTGLLQANPTPRTLLVMGDSLSAAYGLAPEQGWVALLAKRIEPLGWQVVNASISGETTDGGASRIGQALERHSPALVIIELGANDALRGLPLQRSSRNLERMVEASQARAAGVLLLGMQIPPNYGPEYADQFSQMYRQIAEQRGTALLPFLLAPIANERDAFQADQLHPTAAAQPRLLEHVWGQLQPMLSTESVASP